MGSKSAPEYAKTSFDTGGLFGSSTTNKKGTVYNPTDNITGVGNTAMQGWGNTLSSLGNNDYSSDPNFQVFQDNFNRNAQKSFETNVLNPIQSQGLMRSSGLQAATNSFNNTLTDNLADLYDSYYNRQVNNLGQYKDSANTLYNMIMGINQGSMTNSQNVSDYNMKAWQQEQANKQAMINGLVNAAATVAAAPMTGGASLATAGLGKATSSIAGNALSKIGSGLGSLFKKG